MNRSLLGLLLCGRASSSPNAKGRFPYCSHSLVLSALFASALLFAGCGSEAPKPPDQASQKLALPPIPDEVQDAARALLGGETEVLLYGDLALNGKQQLLAANVVPNTPKSTVAGTVVRRAVIAENDDGKWVELMRADEHLKNSKGYLGLTPLQPVNGWKLQYENSPEKECPFISHR